MWNLLAQQGKRERQFEEVAAAGAGGVACILVRFKMKNTENTT